MKAEFFKVVCPYERKEEPKTVKVRNWDGREVFFAGSQTVEA